MSRSSNRRWPGLAGQAIVGAGIVATAGTTLPVPAVGALDIADDLHLTNAEYTFCTTSIGTAVNCYLAPVAAEQASIDRRNYYGDPETDATKMNAFKHAWWTELISFYTGSRSFAYYVTKWHEWAHPGWETDPNHRMDLHNDLVGYNLSAGIIGADFTTYSFLKQFTKSKADSARQSNTGQWPDSHEMVYIC